MSGKMTISKNVEQDILEGTLFQSKKKEKNVIAQTPKHKIASSVDNGFQATSNYTEGDEGRDDLDIYALQLIELIQSDSKWDLAYLTEFEKSVLYRYFYRSNPVIGRIIDLHTDIPLSKIRLQPPSGVPEIVRDYIMQYYERILKRVNFNEILRVAVTSYKLYSTGRVFVDDDYSMENRELQKIETLRESTFVMDEEDVQFISKVEEEYEKKPSSIGLKTRMEYLEKKFLGFFSKTYRGPDSLRHIPFHRVIQELENPDIDYEAIEYDLSSSFESLVEDSDSTQQAVENLRAVGYSNGFIRLAIEESKRTGDSLESLTSLLVDNDELDGLPFMFSLRTQERTSDLRRVLNECLEWEMVKRASRAKILQLGRIGRIVTSEELSEDQVGLLRAEVELMLEDPGHAIVANFPINWEEVNTTIKDELTELIDTTDQLIETISMGLGMPDSLITGDSQYSGDNIKLEVLNTQYLSFKFHIQNIIEEKFLKPIALRKGFIAIDSWGNPELLYPKLSFSRLSVRDEAVYDLLFSLYQKGSLPVGIIYEILNLDPDDMERGLKEDLFTVRDNEFNEIKRDVLSDAAEAVINKTNVGDEIIEGMGLQIDESKVNDEGGSNDRFF